MKKFSLNKNLKINDEPKIDVKTNEKQILKHQILSLMDSFLEISSYNSVSPVYIVPTKITNKELFVEALLDFLRDKIEDKSLKTLESLKSSNKDWLSIDNKIKELKLEKNKIESEYLEDQILSFCERYDRDFISNYIKEVKITFDCNKIDEMINNPKYENIKENLITIKEKSSK